ncbi:MAG: hypothetical protein AMXMBFR13_22430 [Phycisphaerae bacterium]
MSRKVYDPQNETRIQRSSCNVRREQEATVRKWFRGRPNADLVIETPLGFRAGRSRREVRAIGDNPMTVTAGPSGGYLVGEEFAATIEQAQQAYAPMLEVCDVVTTEKGGDMPWAQLDDLTNTGEVVVPNVARDEAPPVAGALVLGAFAVHSKGVVIPWELSEDANPAFLPALYELLAVRIARTVGNSLTTGAGTTAPKGIVTCAAVGVTAASDTVFTPDELQNLVASVDPAYRTQFYGAAFMMNDASRLAIAYMKDGMGRYLFPEAQGPEPTLFGYPLHINPSMVDAGAGTRPVIFGAMRKFKIRTVGEIRVRADAERYAEKDQHYFAAVLRCDSGIAKASATDLPIKCIEMAS